jgi:membrane protein YdbS with pleckstrin-like domain
MTVEASSTQVRRSKFQTKHLVTGETIQWEGRPSIIVYFLRSLLLFLFGVAFGALALLQGNRGISFESLESFAYFAGMFILILLMVAAHRRWGALEALVALVLVVLLMLRIPSEGLNPAFYFGPMIIGLVAFLFEYVLWSHTYFAISDRRIMTQYGVFNLMFADTQIDRVQNVTVVQPLMERILGYGDVMFATAGEMGGIKSDDPTERLRAGGAIVWENVPKPFEVRKIAEEIIFRSTRPTVQYVPQPYVPAPAPVPASMPSVEAEERLVKLKEMREKNLISEEEYQQKRQEILGRL